MMMSKLPYLGLRALRLFPGKEALALLLARRAAAKDVVLTEEARAVVTGHLVTGLEVAQDLDAC